MTHTHTGRPGFSGFMPIQGELENAGYFDGGPSPGGPAPRRQTPLPPPLESEQELEGRSGVNSYRAGLWFYLSLSRPGVRILHWPGGLGMFRPRWRVLLLGDSVATEGADSSAEEFWSAHAEWEALGRPRMVDFAVTFEPVTEEPSLPSDARCSVRAGRYYQGPYWIDRSWLSRTRRTGRERRDGRHHVTIM